MTNNNNVTPQDEGKTVTYQAGGEEIKLSATAIRRFLVSGNAEVTDQEIMMFLSLCKYQKLNPFINEAYIVKFKNKQGPDKPAQLIVSKEAFMKRAESNPEYEGMEAGIIVERDGELVELEGAIKLTNDKLVGGWASVYRADRKKPVKVRISLQEFGKGQATWNSSPMNMIRKTAVVNALREAFPNALGAMYTEDDPQPEHQTNAPIDITQEVDANANQQPLDIEDEPKQIEQQPERVQTKPQNSKPEPEPAPEENPFDADAQQAEMFEDNPPF